MLRVCSLGSGSCGNAMVVEARDGAQITRVLVDNGFGPRQLVRRLARAGLRLQDLDAVIVTHEHDDHVGGVMRLAKRTGLPVYCSPGTARAAGLLAAGLRFESIFSGVCVQLGAMAIDPYEVPHDAAEPLQFVLGDGNRRFGLLTDSGHCSEIVIRALRRAHALLLECNHDGQMLRDGGYPPFLKARIAGPRGHLSNDQAADLISRLDASRLSWLAAGHLSQRNNTPELARLTLSAALNCSPVDIDVADQDGGFDWRTV